MDFRYTQLDRVITGANLLEVLPQVLDELGAEKVLLVASRSLAAASSEFAELRAILGSKCVGLCTSIRSHTPREDVFAAAELARKCKADLLLSLGGGSVIDACKAVQLVLDQNLHSSADLVRYAQKADGSRGEHYGDDSLFCNEPKIRQVAVPTTLSGAEFSNNAGILDTALNAKEGYRAPGLCPRIVIYDPELTQHTPDWLWFSTAIRSLDHAVEGFCSHDATPYLEGHFLHAMRLFCNSLPKTYADKASVTARDLNQQAVWLACAGLGSVAHGASHGIGYILGSYCGVPHGYTSCVMLPAVLAWNASAIGQKDSDISNAMGEPNAAASVAVASLIAQLGLPTTLSDVGVKEQQLDEIARRAFLHPVVRKNPRSISGQSDVREILELAWQGQ